MGYKFIEEAILDLSRIRKSVERIDKELMAGHSISDLIFIQKMRVINRDSYEHIENLESLIGELKQFTDSLGGDDIE